MRDDKRRKKPWVTPKVTVYGDVETLTQNASATNRDTPCGPAANNNAYAPVSQDQAGPEDECFAAIELRTGLPRGSEESAFSPTDI